MFTLRDYQQEAVKKGLEFFRTSEPIRFSTNDKGKLVVQGDIPIIVAPTGAGKSVYIAHMANELKEDVLVLQPSKELLEQNYGKYESYGGRAGVYSASMGVKEIGHVTFAMIGSIKSKASDFSHVRYVIIDECHLVPPDEESMYVSFLSKLPNIRVIGLTATPLRLKKYRDPFSREVYSKINLLMRERPRFFNDFLHVTQIGELYEKGYLSPIKYLEMIWSNGGLKLNSNGSEFSDESVDHSLKQQKIHERIPGIIEQSIKKGRKHRVVFMKNVIDAQLLASRVPESACVHAGTDKLERQRILWRFKNGQIKTIFNVGILTIGFDFPALDTIIIARPTMSLVLYMQMLGRGIRPHPEKKDCALVDMCGNIKRFGKIEEIRYERDHSGMWVVRDSKRVISGVKLSP